jgi:hypothetical protein
VSLPGLQVVGVCKRGAKRHVEIDLGEISDVLRV